MFKAKYSYCNKRNESILWLLLLAGCDLVNVSYESDEVSEVNESVKEHNLNRQDLNANEARQGHYFADNLKNIATTCQDNSFMCFSSNAVLPNSEDPLLKIHRHADLSNAAFGAFFVVREDDMIMHLDTIDQGYLPPSFSYKYYNFNIAQANNDADIEHSSFLGSKMLFRGIHNTFVVSKSFYALKINSDNNLNFTLHKVEGGELQDSFYSFNLEGEVLFDLLSGDSKTFMIITDAGLHNYRVHSLIEENNSLFYSHESLLNYFSVSEGDQALLNGSTLTAIDYVKDDVIFAMLYSHDLEENFTILSSESGEDYVRFPYSLDFINLEDKVNASIEKAGLASGDSLVIKIHSQAENITRDTWAAINIDAYIDSDNREVSFKVIDFHALLPPIDSFIFNGKKIAGIQNRKIKDLVLIAPSADVAAQEGDMLILTEYLNNALYSHIMTDYDADVFFDSDFNFIGEEEDLSYFTIKSNLLINQNIEHIFSRVATEDAEFSQLLHMTEYFQRSYVGEVLSMSHPLLSNVGMIDYFFDIA